jgi:hypothetical protein
MKDKICLLIDVAIRSDRNVIQKESEKSCYYQYNDNNCDNNTIIVIISIFIITLMGF